MAGIRHQFILGLVIRKMREEGITIHNIDGVYPGLFGERTSLPPQILRHRPDAIGIKLDGTICIGEAKTENDVSNNRTYEQLFDFSSVQLNGSSCEVYVGIPKSAETVFCTRLKMLGLATMPNIHMVIIPDEIINA